jgi:predicted metal-dependent enzyme (double-stranded beta helix superfamily)
MQGDYSVVFFIEELRASGADARGDAASLERAMPLLLRLARASSSWTRPQFYECDAEQGFGLTVLHEEPAHGLWLVAVSWLPGRGAPPHNHGTWAVVAGVDGEEENALWRRRGGRLQAQGTHTIGPGQAAGFLPTAIHSVANRGQRTTLSLQSTGETCASWSGASSTHEPAPRIRSS